MVGNENHSITTCRYESKTTVFPCFVASTILSLSPITFLFCASKRTWARNGRTCRWFLSVTGYECELLNTNQRVCFVTRTVSMNWPSLQRVCVFRFWQTPWSGLVDLCGKNICLHHVSATLYTAKSLLSHSRVCVSFLLFSGIALFPGKAQLLSCKHHLRSYIPPLVDPGKPQEIDCVVKEVRYIEPFTNKTQVSGWFYRHDLQVSAI